MIHFTVKKSSILFLCIHHLVVDGVSWRILMEDFKNLYKNRGNSSFELPEKTQSYQAWVEDLYQYANNSKLIREEHEYWKRIVNTEFDSIPDMQKIWKEDSIFANEKKLSFTIDEKSTQLLFKKNIQNYDASVEEILLSTLVEALYKWRGLTNIMIEMEGHGRNKVHSEINVSRTVGWFTSEYPILVKHDGDGNMMDILNKVKTILHDVPYKGVGYGIQKYLSMEGEVLACEPWLSFNYLGELISNDNNEDWNTGQFNRGQPIGDSLQGCKGISIDVMIIDNELKCQLYFNQMELGEDAMNSLLAHYEKELVHFLLQGQLAMLEHHAEKREVQGVEPFCDIFYKDCYVNVLLAILKRVGGEKDYFANNVYAYKYDGNRKGLPIYIKNIEILQEQALLLDMGIHIREESVVIDLIETIKKALDQDRVVIIRVDCFYEENRRDFYQKEHWPHAILVKGYDERKKSFFIIEHDDIDSSQYNEYEISYTSLLESYEGAIERFYDEKLASYFEYSFPTNKIVTNDLDVQKKYIKNIESNSKEIEKGFQYLNQLKEFMDNCTEEYFIDYAAEVIFVINEIINAKKVDNFNKQIIFKGNCKVEEMCNSMLEEFEKIRIQLLKVAYSSKKKKLDIIEIQKRIKIIFDLEVKLHETILIKGDRYETN